MTKGKQIIEGKQVSYAGKMYAHINLYECVPKLKRKLTHVQAKSKLFGQLFIILASKNTPTALAGSILIVTATFLPPGKCFPN